MTSSERTERPAALLKAAAVQLPAPHGADPDWRALLSPWIERAAAEGCGLVAFPRWPLPRPLAPADLDAFELAAQALARQHGIIVVPGAVPVSDRGAVTVRAPVFGPEGKLGEQRQTHFLPEEIARGFVPAMALEPIALPPPAPRGLLLGMLVGLDAWSPEAGRILTMKGASLLIAPLAMPGPYNPWRQVAAMWPQVQQNQVFAIEACAVGRWGETELAGRSSLLAPCETVPNGSGILAQAGIDAAHLPVEQWAAGLSSDGASEPGLIAAELDFEALQRTVDGYSIWAHQNADFYRRIFPGCYEAPAKRERSAG